MSKLERAMNDLRAIDENIAERELHFDRYTASVLAEIEDALRAIEAAGGERHEALFECGYVDGFIREAQAA